MKQITYILFILCFCSSISYAQVHKELQQNESVHDLNISVVKNKIRQLKIKNSSITFSNDFERRNLLSGEIIKVYQKFEGKKNTKNGVLFRFDRQNRLINQYESIAHQDDEIIYGDNIHPAKAHIKNSKVVKNVSRVEQYSVYSIDPTQSSQQVFSYADSEISLNNGKIECTTLTALNAEVHASEDITYNVESPGDDAYLLGGETTEAKQKKFAEIMCFHHLFSVDDYVKNQYAEYQALGNNIPNYPITAQVGFDPRGSTTGFTRFDLFENSININYPGRDNDKDYAEDGYMIRREYFRGYHSFVNDGNQSTGEGIDQGIADYIANSSFDNATSNFIHNWANIINPLNINYYNTFSSNNLFTNSQSLSTVLWYMHHVVLDENRTTSIVFDVLSILKGTTVSKQYEAAIAIYNTAINIPDLITEVEKCRLATVLTFVYGEEFADGIESPLDADFIIQDSYEGQSHWQQGIQGEDIGNEPNDITTAFSSSPDIWNRINDETTVVKDHQNPEYTDATTPNYLYVDVRVDACDIPFGDNNPDQGDLHVYIRESHLGGEWPIDWTNGVFNGEQVGYEITPSEGIPLSSYEDWYIDFYPGSGSFGNVLDDQFWRVYRYKIPWIPINPDALSGYTQPDGSIWACLLARIESSTDPMTFPEGTGAWVNNVNNNNIAINNTSIHTSEGFTGGNGGVVSSVLNIKSPHEGTGTNGDPEELDIEIAIHPNEDITAEGDPIIPSTTGPGDPVIFDYIDLEIILSHEFLIEWTSSGLQGTGFTWVNANTIKVTSPNFAINNIKLPPRRDHRIFVKTTSKQDFTSIDFTLLLKDFTNNPIGSQTYNNRGSLWIDKGGIKRSDTSISDAMSSIKVNPNPAQNFVTATSNTTEIIKIEVYNVRNERVNVSFDAVDAHTTRVDIANLSSGIYFMKVQRAENIETIKFVKTQ